MKILFLTHRLPYAPNRGDRIRAYHELRALVAAGHDVDLLSLVHDSDEEAHAGDLRAEGIRVHACRVSRIRNLLRSACLIAGHRPLTHVLLDGPQVRPLLASLRRVAPPDLVIAYCSGMARFAMEAPLAGIPFVLDMVDVDSAKWAALSDRANLGLKWVYRREARLLSAFEAEATRRSLATFVVNEREAEALRPLVDSAARVSVLQNGVDVRTLRPASPPGDSHDVVFCGVMNYTPNEEGAIWLIEKVWPAVSSAWPNARLWLVGTNPTARLRDRARRNPSVVLTGTVADVRPYLWQSAVAAAPLLVARGVQNKVLEAVAAGLPCVVTRVVAEGLPAEVVPACRVATSAPEFARGLLELLSLPPERRRALASLATLETISWQARLAPLLEAVRRVPLRPPVQQHQAR